MTDSLPYAIFVIPILIGLPCAAIGWDPASPDDPGAHSAAKTALADSPKNRRLISDIRIWYADVRDLTGVDGTGVGLQRNIEDLEQVLEALDAKIVAQEIHVSLAADLLFDFDRYEVKPEAEVELKKLIVVLQETGSGKVRIIGHTDAVGSADYNLRLSEKRAKSIKHWLLGSGSIASQVAIETLGRGESEPVAPNSNHDGSDNAEGRTLNRRVEIVIKTRNPVARQTPAFSP